MFPKKLKLIAGSAAVLAALTLLFDYTTFGFRAFTSAAAARLQQGPLPKAIPVIPLLSASGASISFDEYKGNTILVSFMFTSCAQACPTTIRKLQRIQAALERQGQAGIKLLSISVDPDHDTPEMLTHAAMAHGANPTFWHFAVPADYNALGMVQRTFGLWVQKRRNGTIDHDVFAAVVDKHGLIRRNVDLDMPTEALQMLLIEQLVNEGQSNELPP